MQTEFQKRLLTQSDCYQAGRTIVPRGVMVHSTGVAQPDPEVFLRRWDRPGVDACVHAFVAEDRVIQTLPWNWRGWHAGRGERGSANDTHISFECCEPVSSTHLDVYKRQPHDYPGHWVRQQYLPDNLKNRTYYQYGDNKTEPVSYTHLVGDGVLVDGDIDLVQAVLHLLAGEVGRAQVHQHQVVVRAAGYQVRPTLHDGLGQHGGVFHDLLLISLELGLEGLAQRHRLGGNDVLQRTALGAGEDGGVELFGDVRVVAQQHPAPGAPEGLVGGGGHHIGVGNGGGVAAGGHQPGDVGHVHEQIGPHLSLIHI